SIVSLTTSAPTETSSLSLHDALPISDGIKQPFTGILNEVQDVIKTTVAAVVRVRDFVHQPHTAIVKKQLGLGTAVLAPDITDVRQVLPVHDQDIIKGVQVCRTQLTRSQPTEINSTPPGSLQGTAVRRTAAVPVTGARS